MTPPEYNTSVWEAETGICGDLRQKGSSNQVASILDGRPCLIE